MAAGPQAHSTSADVPRECVLLDSADRRARPKNQ